jgi:NADH:ubiquinone oxidoreductase subunit 6 (subunit J)
MQQVIFYILGFLIVTSALIILITKNIIYAVYLLVLCLLGIAGLYFLAGAEFIAVTQIIIYAGGILVLLIFGIMLTNRVHGQKVLSGFVNLIPGVVLGFLFLFILIKSILQVDFTSLQVNDPARETGFTGTQSIGIELMTRYVLPFEIAGFLLLIALIGASLLAGKNFGIKKDDAH